MKVLITGGTRGIGRAIALAFAREGASVALCARGADELKKLEEELNELNGKGRHLCFQADCSQKAELESFLKQVQALYEEIDVLVNNAALYEEGDLLTAPEGNLEGMIQLNLMAAYYCARFVAPFMKARAKGQIFNICSIASRQAVPGAGGYTVSKHALLGLSRALREELQAFGIGVTAVLPGATNTSSWAGSSADTSRMIDPEDVAATLLAACRLGVRANIDELLITPLHSA